MENKTSAINIQVDSNVKKEATDVLTELGLSMSSAINLFLKQVVKKNGIPFEITNVSPKKKILDVVCGLIMKDGKCLIAQRKKEDHLYGKWEFPGGRRVGLEDEKKKVVAEIERASKMLANPGFVNKAPEAKINEEKAKLDKYQEMLKSIEERLK